MLAFVGGTIVVVAPRNAVVGPRLVVRKVGVELRLVVVRLAVVVPVPVVPLGVVAVWELLGLGAGRRVLQG